MKQQSVIFIIIALVVGFALGLILGLSAKPGLTPLTGGKNEFAIKKAFLTELRGKGILPPEPESITDASGKVKEVKDNQLTIILDDRFDDPLREFLPEVMTVNINENTEIFKIEQKAADILAKEEKDFEQKIKQYGDEIPAELTPPEPFRKINIKISDIKPGDQLTISSNSNFKGKSELTAASVQVETNPDTTEPSEIPGP